MMPVNIMLAQLHIINSDLAPSQKIYGWGNSELRNQNSELNKLIIIDKNKE